MSAIKNYTFSKLTNFECMQEIMNFEVKIGKNSNPKKMIQKEDITIQLSISGSQLTTY